MSILPKGLIWNCLMHWQAAKLLCHIKLCILFHNTHFNFCFQFQNYKYIYIIRSCQHCEGKEQMIENQQIHSDRLQLYFVSMLPVIIIEFSWNYLMGDNWCLWLWYTFRFFSPWPRHCWFRHGSSKQAYHPLCNINLE